MAKGSHERGIAGAASVVGGATALSRVLGYIRDAVIALVFGAGMQADSFFVAFRIANFLRRLVGEGALTSSFVPIFTEELGRRPPEGSRDLASSVFTLFAIILIALTVIGVLFSGPLVRLMSPGFTEDAEKFSLTVSLTRAMFPYMVFIGLMAIAMGVLNSLRHFAAPAMAPIFFNISIILSVVAIAPCLDEPVYALAVGVLAGGFLQLAVQFPYLKRFGYVPRPLFRFDDPGIRKIFLLMGPAAFGVGVYQLNILVTLWFASQLPEGSVSYLYYAGRLMELPLGVFGVAVSTAVLPSLSEHASRNDREGFRNSLSFAVRAVNFVTIPSMIGFFVLSYPIIEVLFERGEFGAGATTGTAVALYYYAIGLVPVSISRVLASVYYSMKDASTPVRVALASFAANVLFCLVLVGPLGHGGLALATSLSSFVNAIMLFAILRKKSGRVGGRLMLSSFLRALVASLAMGAILYIVIVFSGYRGFGFAAKSGFLVVCLSLGVILFLLFARALRTPEVAFLKGILDRRRGL